jgi:hypothetical protein
MVNGTDREEPNGVGKNWLLSMFHKAEDENKGNSGSQPKQSIDLRPDAISPLPQSIRPTVMEPQSIENLSNQALHLPANSHGQQLSFKLKRASAAGNLHASMEGSAQAGSNGTAHQDPTPLPHKGVHDTTNAETWTDGGLHSTDQEAQSSLRCNIASPELCSTQGSNDNKVEENQGGSTKPVGGEMLPLESTVKAERRSNPCHWINIMDTQTETEQSAAHPGPLL